ncbi:hypothetical protein OG225_34145 [Nocardia sp. NBC_01377]|uniref:hypothetical protein n=1 Tax=Nocardia sp. NBC_01377 TaxID=2903595 RepID=UPI0032526968
MASHPVSSGGRNAEAAESQMIALHDAAAVISVRPDYASPSAKMKAVAGLLKSGRFSMLVGESE